MIKEHLKTTFFDKIKQNANIAIFGSGVVGRGILSDIKKYRPDVKVKCFIDTYNTGNVEGIDILPFSRVDELKDIDLVVGSTRRDYSLVMNIFQYYGINFLPEERFIEYHYRNPHSPLTDENLDKILDIFNDEADKELFRLIFSSRICLVNDGMVDYAYKNHGLRLYYNARNIYKQYVDRIVRDKINVIYDLGFFDGRNFLAFKKLIPNLKKIYAFEAIYDLAKNPAMDAILKRENIVEIIETAIADKDTQAVFALDTTLLSGSMLKDISTKKFNSKIYNELERKVNVTTIDNYIKRNDILPPNLIKMDIEGAELPALEGAIKTIQKYRPQLAISIYHTDNDFINIPLYLSKNLENYSFGLGHYSYKNSETVLYAIPNEIK